MARERKVPVAETAESMAQKQREISVSEFFLKNRHLLGFDSPRKALLTAVKEAVDNSLDACEEAGILPEIGVDITQLAEDRFKVSVTDNGPGIVKAQIPRIFAKLLYGSKFHRLRMSRGQQGIGISAAGMYGQLTTGASTRILSKVKGSKMAHHMEVQIDTRANKPAILTEEETDWLPVFLPVNEEGKPGRPIEYKHGTGVEIVMEAAYVRGKLSVDEYIKQCAIVNPHLQLHYRLALKGKAEGGKGKGEGAEAESTSAASAVTYARAVNRLPEPPTEIKPHPHGVELGLLMQMLKGTAARTLRSALTTDFSRVGDRSALEICERAGLNPKANPTRIAHQESEALYKAIQETKLMRPPTDCLSPIGEAQILAGLKKEIAADFYTAVTREPEVYRGNPFQVEVGLAYAKPGENQELGAEEPVRVLRFANRVPLLYQGGACGMTEAVTDVNWKTYGLAQPKGGLPVGPMVILLHMASVWVPFTSESKEAIAHYPEILKEFTYALQECGRQLSVYLSRRRRQAEVERKRSYIEMYIPHLALGLKEILEFDERKEKQVIQKLGKMLEKTHLDV
ncbi:MAG TPA: DNA topoisomerase VI subunit B [Kiritimatiellia bacterium]|nr:DNA topoisomerase VI subunit B [Kiritimatiellia bacterium]HSA18438.1 DNA topoisomerase VI subunit B [Kiritimatiellia bacterium]